MINFYKDGGDIYLEWELSDQYEGDQEIDWIGTGTNAYLLVAYSYSDGKSGFTDWVSTCYKIEYWNRNEGEQLIVSNFDPSLTYYFGVIGNRNWRSLNFYWIVNEDFFDASSWVDALVYAFKGTSDFNFPNRQGMTPPLQADIDEDYLAYFQEVSNKQPLPTPTGLYADNITSDSATTHWTGDENASNYKVQYKAAGDTVWTETYTD